MPAVPSTMMPLGTPAPDFLLPDTVSGEMMSLARLSGTQATLVMFICNHCPYVVRINQQLVQLATDYAPRGVGFVAISSNDAARYPQDGPEAMKEAALHLGYPFPYLYDESQEVARQYQAACTPDFFLFDRELRCVYRGQSDDARPSNQHPADGKDLRAALDALLEGRLVASEQKPSIGCSIKWKDNP